ncbi:hypothetical protein DMC30DRAFT_194901 [Rhodotorula diobovata]|uniref:Uncharacterized protein n=1 Tax=Rhodotorula diobovata TaxID=5288 RepID=A0A5C5FXI7_9BASI|nr:hypothetical protein DMC30DRAFT_194901 [Rhodotorula diobovata]
MRETRRVVDAHPLPSLSLRRSLPPPPRQPPARQDAGLRAALPSHSQCPQAQEPLSLPSAPQAPPSTLLRPLDLLGPRPAAPHPLDRGRRRVPFTRRREAHERAHHARGGLAPGAHEGPALADPRGRDACRCRRRRGAARGRHGGRRRRRWGRARPRHDARRPLPTPSLRPAARRPLPHSLARLRLVVALLVPAPAQRPSTTRRPAAAPAPRRLAAAAAPLGRAGRVLLAGGRARRGHGHGHGHGALGVRRLGAQHGLGRRVRGRGGHAARRAGTGAGSGSGSGSGVAAQAFWRWGRPRGRRRRGRVEGHDGVSRRLREVREAGAGALDACRVELVRREEDEECFFLYCPPALAHDLHTLHRPGPGARPLFASPHPLCRALLTVVDTPCAPSEPSTCFRNRCFLTRVSRR